MAEVTDVDAGGRRVTGRRPLGGSTIEFRYDDLIVAAGVRQSYFGHDEFAPLGARHEDDRGRAGDPPPGLRRVRDGRDRDRSGRAARAGSRSPWSAPGPTGVELAGQIRELATKTLRDEFRQHRARRTRGCCCSTAATRRWPRSGRSCRPRRPGRLQKLGVEQHMGSIVTHVDAGGLERPRPGRQRDPVRGRHRAVDRRGGGAAGRRPRSPRRPARSRTGPGGSSSSADLTIPGHPGDLGHRGHDEPATSCPAWPRWPCRPGLYAGRRIRHQVAGRSRRQAVPLPRPGLGRLHLPRSARSSRRAGCA